MAVGILLTLLLLRAALLAHVLFDLSGGYYYWISDYPVRVLMAWDWLHGAAAFHNRMWLPLGTFMTAAALKLWPATFLAPAVANILISSGALALVYGISGRLFGGRSWVNVLSVSAMLLDLLYAQISLSGGASEIYFHFFLLAGALWMIRFEDSGSSWDLACAAVLFAVSNGVRHESWLFALWPACRLIGLVQESLRSERGGWKALGGMVLLAVLWSPAACWCAVQFRAGLYPMVSIGHIRLNFKQGVAFAEMGSRLSWRRLIALYPSELWRESPEFLILSSLGFVFSLSSAGGRRCRAYMGCMAFAFFCLVFSPLLDWEIPGSYPRVLVVFKLLLSPFWGYAVWTGLEWLRDRTGMRRAWPALVVLALSVRFALAGSRLVHIPQMGLEVRYPDLERTAYALARMRRTLRDRMPGVLFEARTIRDMEAFKNGDLAGLYAPIRYADPEAIPSKRTAGSEPVDVFALPGRDFVEFCGKNRVGLIVTSSPEGAEKARQAAQPVCRMEGGFAIFSLGIPEADAAVIRRIFAESEDKP